MAPSTSTLGLLRTLGTRVRDAVEEAWAMAYTDATLRQRFIDDCFDSPEEYRRYAEEFDTSAMDDIWQEASDQYKRVTGKSALGTIQFDIGRDYYALVRKHRPETIIETGVCNGMSSLCILLALEENDAGHLYSIDYPYRADESLAEFRAETFDDYGGAAIPADKDPGWIIPEELRDRWTLRLGKSQRKLPELVTEVGDFGMFFHDSEHSAPCMMFEFELAWEWLEPGGVIVSDDITWNWSFPTFVEVRHPTAGKISDEVGYMVK